MKTIIALMALSIGSFAQQSATQPANPAAGGAPLVTAVISSQGTDVIKQTTGYGPKNTTLIRIDICNSDTANDHNQSVSGAMAAILLQEQYGIYGSDVVNTVLVQLQSKDVFTRAQKAISAGANAVTLLTALFKTLSPTTVAIMQAAPAIAQAVLPAVGDPRDLAALGQKIYQDNTALTLGKKGSGNDCHSGLAVAMTGAVKIEKVTLQ
jgi:hypothetical protein